MRNGRTIIDRTKLRNGKGCCHEACNLQLNAVAAATCTTTSATKHGENTEKRANTIPAVGIPFGMTQWVAQTCSSEQKCLPPYMYKDNLLNGFRGTHWLSGSCVPDYGSFTIMPITGKLQTRTADYAVPFSPEIYSGHFGRHYSINSTISHLRRKRQNRKSADWIAGISLVLLVIYIFMDKRRIRRKANT